MTPAEQPVGPRGLALRAALEGKAAGFAGASHASCPYAASRPFTRRAWLLGYVAGVALDPDRGQPRRVALGIGRPPLIMRM